MTEADPNGTDQHTTGAKLDAGKVRVGLVLGSFARALWKVCEVGTFGAGKYTDNGWLDVEDGQNRYEDAGLRHYLKAAMGESRDPDSELEHLAHEAWNALARLELASLKMEENERGGGITSSEMDAMKALAKERFLMEQEEIQELLRIKALSAVEHGKYPFPEDEASGD